MEELSHERPVVPRPVHIPRRTIAELWYDWRHDSRVGAAALMAAALVAGFIWYRMGATEPAPPTRTERRTSVSVVSASSTTTTSAPARLVVHVAGAVTHPGVVEVASGARVIDAIEAAGGALPDGDLDRLNLAAKLIDGERILVTKPGDPPMPVSVAAPGGATPDAATPSDGPIGPIDLNAATQTQLETLPGIGPTLAQAIITTREQRGGFKSVGELRDVRGIGERRFSDLQPLVTVG